MIKFFLKLLGYNKASKKPVAATPIKPIPPPPKPPEESETPWMDIAKHELGISEIMGSKNNPRILEYHDATSLKADDDETPWCASFVSWVLRNSGYTDTNSAGAAKYLNYGVKLTYPKYGCIVIYKRTGGNHVHFYDHEDAQRIYGIGGNQDNEVNIKGYQKSNVLGYVWPIKKQQKQGT